jgi:hypothetical protein
MAKANAQPAPHSWSVSKWPAHVWPGDSTKGKRFCRTYEDALLAVGALTRMGRDLVVMGGPFTEFMRAQAHRVGDFEVPCNRPEHAAKRNGATKGAAA